nr:ankyrin repeat domain-containing protein [uncultured Flavobacterium sp.]
MKKLLFLIFLFSIVSYGQANKNTDKDIFDTARYGSVEEMKILTAKKADTINGVNAMGFSPLILACYKGNTEVAAYLIERVKDVNYNSSSGTALSATVVKGNINLAKMLLQHKANPDLADANGVTPLIYAIQFKNKELIALLLEYKASKTIADASGKMPFEYAVFTKDQEIINLFKN